MRQVREDDAHLLGKALSRNATLERLLVDKTALSVQHLLSGARLVRPWLRIMNRSAAAGCAHALTAPMMSNLAHPHRSCNF